MRGSKVNCAIFMSLTAGSASFVSAHTIIDSLGAPMKAVDIHQVSCSNDGNGEPTKLVVQIKDLPPVAAPTLSVLTFKGGTALSVSDLTDGDALFSRKSANTGGTSGADGVFYLMVNKTAAGVESYQVEAHCIASGSGSDEHTGTDINILQNR